MMLNVIPVGLKIIVRPVAMGEEKSAGGMVIAGNTLEKAEVLAVSPYIKQFFKGDHRGIYEVGDIILYPGKKGVSHVFIGEACLFLDTDPQKEEIYCIVEKAKKPELSKAE